MMYLYRADNELALWSIAKRGLIPGQEPKVFLEALCPASTTGIFLTKRLERASRFAALVIEANLLEIRESLPVTAVRVDADAVEDVVRDYTVPDDVYVPRMISPQNVEAWDLRNRRWFPVIEIQDDSGIVVRLSGEGTQRWDALEFINRHWPCDD